MYNFTPLSALTGGIIIGCAVVLFFYSTGRLAGISGIFANVFINKSNKISNLLFLLGLVLGPLGYFYFTQSTVSFEITNSFILVLIVGLISGTYSSIAIATQILVYWDERRKTVA